MWESIKNFFKKPLAPAVPQEHSWEYSSVVDNRRCSVCDRREVSYTTLGGKWVPYMLSKLRHPCTDLTETGK